MIEALPDSPDELRKGSPLIPWFTGKPNLKGSGEGCEYDRRKVTGSRGLLDDVLEKVF